MSLDAAILNAINTSSARLAADRVPVGGVVDLSASMPGDFTIDGARFLRAGLIETDKTKFNAELFKLSVLLPLIARDTASFTALCHSPAGVFVGAGGAEAFRSKTDTETAWTAGSVTNLLDAAASMTAAIAVGNSLIFRLPIQPGTTGGVGAAVSVTNPIASTNFGMSLAYGGGVFVIASKNAIARSTNDGTSFAAVSNPLPAQAVARSYVGFGDGKFLVVSNGKVAMSSDLGATWSLVADAVATRAPFFANERWYVQNGAELYQATDSAVSGWAKVATLTSTNQVLYDDGIFIQPTVSGIMAGPKPDAMFVVSTSTSTFFMMSKRNDGSLVFVGGSTCYDGIAVHAGLSNGAAPSSGTVKYMRVS